MVHNQRFLSGLDQEGHEHAYTGRINGDIPSTYWGVAIVLSQSILVLIHRLWFDPDRGHHHIMEQETAPIL